MNRDFSIKEKYYYKLNIYPKQYFFFFKEFCDRDLKKVWESRRLSKKLEDLAAMIW